MMMTRLAQALLTTETITMNETGSLTIKKINSNNRRQESERNLLKPRNDHKEAGSTFKRGRESVQPTGLLNVNLIYAGEQDDNEASEQEQTNS